MAANTIDRGQLRRLADVRPERGRVLSVFLNLDPSQFATVPARASAITSVVDAAQR
jgi:peptide chain release factor subunit 1